MILSNKQKQYLKGLAHSLKPVVMLGGNGLTDNVVAEIDSALAHHELIKVKVPTPDKEEKQVLINAIVEKTQSYKLQVIGHVLVIYRPAEEPEITLPNR